MSATIPPNNSKPGDGLHDLYHNNISDCLSYVFGDRYVPTAIQTINYTAAPADLALFDTTAGNLTCNLPIAPADGTSVCVKMVGTSGGHTVTVQAGGSDQFDADGTTTRVLSGLNQSIALVYKASNSRWYGLQGENAASGFSNPMSTLGDIIYGGTGGSATRLAGDTSNTRKFLRELSSGGVAAAPAWDTLTTADIPSLSATYAPLAGATFTGQSSPAVVALTDAATIAVNAALGNDFRVTLGGNRTLGNPTNSVDGQKIMFQVTQDGTGTRTLAYGTNYSFSTSLASPTLTTTINKTDLLGFVYNATKGKWLFIAFVAGFS